MSILTIYSLYDLGTAVNKQSMCIRQDLVAKALAFEEGGVQPINVSSLSLMIHTPKSQWQLEIHELRHWAHVNEPYLNKNINILMIPLKIIKDSPSLPAPFGDPYHVALHMPVSANVTSTDIRRRTSVAISTVLCPRTTAEVTLVAMMKCRCTIGKEGA